MATDLTAALTEQQIELTSLRAQVAALEAENAFIRQAQHEQAINIELRIERCERLEAVLKLFADIYEGYQIWQPAAILWSLDSRDIVDYIIEMSWAGSNSEVRPDYYDNLRDAFKAAADALGKSR